MREAERIEVDRTARLYPNGWSSVELRLLDCSSGGFRGTCEARVRVGDLVTLELAETGPVRAYVSWTRDGEFGARFLDHFPLEAAGLKPLGGEARLARLLVARAAAHRANLHAREQSLRDEIGRTLPLRRPPDDPKG